MEKWKIYQMNLTKMFKSVSQPASRRGNLYLNIRVISRPTMSFDPIYLSEEASPGVLSSDGNFCIGIVSRSTELSQENSKKEIRKPRI